MSRFDDLSTEQLEDLRRMIEEMDTIDAISDDIREIVEKHWPWLLSKLPPQTKQ